VAPLGTMSSSSSIVSEEQQEEAGALESPLLLLEEEEEEEDDFCQNKRDGRRWEQLGMYVCLNIGNQMAWVQYTSVPKESAEAFGVPLSAVTALATAFPATYVPGSILAARAMRRGSLRSTLRESAFLMVAGSAWKILGAAVAFFGNRGGGYALTFLGQVLVGLGQPHLVNSPAALATDWFPVDERDLAATLGLLGSILGQAFGEALCPVVVQAAAAAAEEGIFVSCLFVSVPVVLSALWTFLRFENNDDDEGPLGGERRRRRRRTQEKTPTTGAPTSLLASWYLALKGDRELVILWLAFCVGMSVFNSLLQLAAQWLALCGYSDTVVGFASAVFVLVGIPAAAVVGAVLDKTRAYRPVLKGLAFSAFSGTLLLVVAARKDDVVPLYLAFAFLGGSLVAASAAIMETAVELTYPKPPELSTGLLFCGGNVLGVAVTYGLLALIDLQQGSCRPLDDLFHTPISAPVAIALLLSFALCAALLLAYRGPYRRLHAEQLRARLSHVGGGGGAD